MSRILHPPRRCGPAGTGRHDAPLEPLLGHTRHPHRTEPLLPLHRYRASDELTEIRGSELSFTSKEATRCCDCTVCGFPSTRRPPRWTAPEAGRPGLRLCALAARVSADPNSA